ncbi:MAG TPA: helix-turn-helix domain-containing protein [Candidatus Nanoarchaeia archaeon]|nr:helix-turn-helix domain-containing protein [Candidatus Nanoarchaeia archaeon]
MLVKNELIAKIKDYFDLNIYETKVWLALLGKGSASAGEIATLSGVPRSRTYDVLESLEKKGFAIVKIGKPVKYLGVKPKTILEKLKNNVRNQAEEKVQNLSKVTITNEFKQLEELYNVGINPVKREDLSASIKGRSTISTHLKEIIDSAKKEVIVCMNAEEMELKEKLFAETFNSLKKKGIEVKVALFGNPEIVKKLSKLMNLEIIPVKVEGKFFIIDRKEVLFYISKETTKDDHAIWLNSEFFSEAFAGLFDMALQ